MTKSGLSFVKWPGPQRQRGTAGSARRPTWFRYRLGSLFALTFLSCCAADYQRRDDGIRRERLECFRQLQAWDLCVGCDAACKWWNQIDKLPTNQAAGLFGTNAFVPSFRTKSVDFSCCGVTTHQLKFVKQLPEVKVLGLRRCNITDELLACVSDLQQLEKLYLDDSDVTDREMAIIGGFTNLRMLSLANTRVTNNGLACLGNLKKLESLNCDGTLISDAGLVHLRQLRTLQEVRFYQTNVTASAVADLDEQLPLSELHSPLILGQPMISVPAPKRRSVASSSLNSLFDAIQMKK